MIPLTAVSPTRTISTPIARTVTAHPNTGDPRRIDLAEHMHIPAVDGDTGAITLLLGLDGEDHDQVRLALGHGRDAREVLDQAIAVLSACRSSLDRCACGEAGPHAPAKYIGPGTRGSIDSTVRTCPGIDPEAGR